MNLFDVPVELVAPDTARALIDQFGYDERKVRRWTREKGETVLAKRRREQTIVEMAQRIRYRAGG